MPCNCDHLEPTAAERHRKLAAELLIYVYPKFRKAVPRWVRDAAKDVYGEPPSSRGRDDAVAELCEFMGSLSPEHLSYALDVTSYYTDPATLKKGIALLEWWAEHQENDKKRKKR